MNIENIVIDYSCHMEAYGETKLVSMPCDWQWMPIKFISILYPIPSHLLMGLFATLMVLVMKATLERNYIYSHLR